METYIFLREVAGSIVLVGLFGMFLGIILWAFLPSQRKAREDASMIPFRGDDNPAGLVTAPTKE